MLDHRILLLLLLVAAWFVVRSRRNAWRQVSLRDAIDLKTRSLLHELKLRKRTAGEVVANAMTLLTDNVPDRLNEMTVSELSRVNKAFDEAIRKVKALPLEVQ